MMLLVVGVQVLLVQERCKSIFRIELVQLVLLTLLIPISNGEETVILVFFAFPFPLKILIVSYRVGDVDKKWADFAWGSW